MDHRKIVIDQERIFEKSNFPMTFYAHTMKFIQRNCYDKRCAVEFEAVPKDDIQMFVTGERPAQLPKPALECQTFSEIWEYFQRGGLKDLGFINEKIDYLGRVGCAQIDIMLHSFIKARSIADAKNDWWEITIDQEPVSKTTDTKDACLFEMTGYEPMNEEFSFEIKAVSEETEEKLYELYTCFEEDKPVKKTRNSLGEIGSETTLGEVQVLYVGAALCCRLVDINGNIVGYFDMGVEASYSRYRLPQNDPRRDASMQSREIVLNDAQQVSNLSVIISHWHNDHVQILTHMACNYVFNSQNTSYEDFWKTSKFIYPEMIRAKGWACIAYAIFTSALRRAGNEDVLVAAYEDNSHNDAIQDFETMTIYKCDRDDSGIWNKNAHDHGIWAKVTLANNMKTVFLAGDCTYDIVGCNDTSSPVLTNGARGYNYLVASHHGGIYSHTQSRDRKNYIPKPVGEGAPVVYSANGIAYGHPNAQIQGDYQNVGWEGISLHERVAEGEIRYSIT